MNLIAKCNGCVHEKVCKFCSVYQSATAAVLNTTFNTSDGRLYTLKDCPYIEVSIKCPNMVTASAQRNGV